MLLRKGIIHSIFRQRLRPCLLSFHCLNRCLIRPFRYTQKQVHKNQLGNQRAQAGIRGTERTGIQQQFIFMYFDLLKMTGAAVGLALSHIVPVA